MGYRGPGFIHTTLIPVRGKPNQAIKYRFGSNAVGWSSVSSFLVPPSSSQTDPPLKFLAFVDVGVQNSILLNLNSTDPNTGAPVLKYNRYGANSSKLAQSLAKEVAHLALVPGDLSYR